MDNNPNFKEIITIHKKKSHLQQIVNDSFNIIKQDLANFY